DEAADDAVAVDNHPGDPGGDRVGPSSSRIRATNFHHLTGHYRRLARWHDVLFFSGFDEAAKPAGIEMPPLTPPPLSLRDAALEAEESKTGEPSFIRVSPSFNERLVDAVYQAVLRLETRGYYTGYHLVLGETLWRALHEPTKGSLVLPRERIKPTLLGDGEFHRTTTLPANEALLVSKDGPTFDCVVAGDAARQPRFEFLRVAPDDTGREELYLFRIRERFTPRIRESRAVVRLVADASATSTRTS
ncbi:MAG: encapsulin, partial [Vicinamibacterales bacterium]